MKSRVEFGKVEPAAMQAMMALEHYVRNSGIDKTILELIKMRASQINGCAFCIDMHSKDARHAGESEQRLYALNAWQETPFFSPQERAALALTEEVTQIAGKEVSDGVYEEISRHFTPPHIVQLVMAIATINAWNRIMKTTHSVPGSYQVSQAA